MRHVRPVQLILLVSTVALTGGCDSNARPKTVPISGSVSYGGGAWPAAGQIHFLPLQPAEGYPRRPASATFAEDGKFGSPTSWEEGDGIVPGTYRVYVECWKIKPTINGPPSVSYVADKYVSGAASDIEVDIAVDSQDESFQWDITPRSG